MFVSEYMRELEHQQKATPLLVHILCQHHQLHQQQVKVMGRWSRSSWLFRLFKHECNPYDPCATRVVEPWLARFLSCIFS